MSVRRCSRTSTESGTTSDVSSDRVGIPTISVAIILARFDQHATCDVAVFAL